MMDEEMSFEDQLQEAIRRRLLEEIGSSKQSQVVNNLYGGGAPSGGASSIQEAMQPSFNPRDYEYFVEIDKTPRKGPEGEDLGWEKLVRRYAQRAEQ